MVPAIQAHRTFLSSSHFPSLNGLRFFSALAIIKEHSHLIVSEPRMLQFGWMGVDLFFVLSGFLIVTLLLREKSRSGTISLKRFYGRRACRIFPIYYLLVLAALALYGAASPWAPSGLRYYALTFPVLLLYAQDFVIVPLGIFFHTWSLAMEEQFYLVWPFLEKVLRGNRMWYVLGGLLVVSQLVNFGAARRLIEHAYGTPAAVRLPVFLITFTPILLGAALAHALHAGRPFTALYRIVGNRTAPLVIVALMIVAFQLVPPDVQGAPRLVIHVLMALLIAALVMRPDNFLRPLLDHRLVDRLGVISYGLYLYHVIVITVIVGAFHKLGHRTVSPLELFAMAAMATVGIAELSYRYVETPFLELRSRFSSRRAPVLESRG